MGPYYDIASMQHLKNAPELDERRERARLGQERRAKGGGPGILLILCALALLVPFTGI